MKKLILLSLIISNTFAIVVDTQLLNSWAYINNEWKKFDFEIKKTIHYAKVGKRRYSEPTTNKYRIKKTYYLKQKDTYDFINDFYFELKKNKNQDVPISLIESHLNHVKQSALVIFSQIPEDKNRLTYKEISTNIINRIRDFETFVESSTTSSLIDDLVSLTEVKEKVYAIHNANEVCQVMGSPGDIILRKALLYDGTYDYDFSSELMSWITILETLKLNFDDLIYRHAEVVTKAESYGNIETLSFYPFMDDEKYKDGYRTFLFIQNGERPFPKYSNYRNHYSMFRVKSISFEGEAKKKSKALGKALEYDRYSQMGVCSDFINWLYGNSLTSNWNFIPGIKQIVQVIYPPEGIQTPDNLAESYMTEKVCENNSSGGFWPTEIDLKQHLKRLIMYSKSNNEVIANHALLVINKLKNKGFISKDNKPLFDRIIFKKRQPLRD